MLGTRGKPFDFPDLQDVGVGIAGCGNYLVRLQTTSDSLLHIINNNNNIAIPRNELFVVGYSQSTMFVSYHRLNVKCYCKHSYFVNFVLLFILFLLFPKADVFVAAFALVGRTLSLKQFPLAGFLLPFTHSCGWSLITSGPAQDQRSQKMMTKLILPLIFYKVSTATTNTSNHLINRARMNLIVA